MSTTTLPPPKRPRRTPSGPRLRLAAPIPRLPRSVRALDLAYGRRHTDWPPGARFPLSREAEPFTTAELTTDVKGRLLARAEARQVRLYAAERLASRERFWLTAELRLILMGGVHPNVVRRWRRAVSRFARHAAERLTEWRTLEGLLLAHEPGADAWLRKRLMELPDPWGGRL